MKRIATSALTIGVPTEQQHLEAGMAALEAQRALLGSAVVDVVLGPIRARLQALRGHSAQTPDQAQSLRQVSILFLDVVGSTALAQRLDTEEFSAVMDGALRRSTAIVHAYRGRVHQYAGDSILATFGSAEASEDDAERAVRCGLALLELGRLLSDEVLATHAWASFGVRVGIHSGSVLIGGGGGGAGDENAIRGLAVNIAARMEQMAPAGALRISRDAYLQVRGLFEVALQEPLAVKGVDEAMVSYLVVKPKPHSFRIVSRGIEGVSTQMVGRDAEFGMLQLAFKRLFAERQLIEVSLVAEAGLGKSRLLDEFQAWVEDRPESVSAFHGRATPQTQGQPFGLLRDIVARRLHLRDADTQAEAKAKLEAGLMPLFADEMEFAEGHVHLLGYLIGLDWKDSQHVRGILDDPGQILNRAQHAAAQMFRRVSDQGGAPVILQLEDLHWADDESLNFLQYLSEVNRDMPLLVLALTRPTLFERRSDWKSTGGRHERIDLQPLDHGARRALVNELLKRLPEVPAMLSDLIIGRAEGNPFYTEELVCMLIDQGAIDASGGSWQLHADRLLATQVPVTLTGVLQARLDGLPALERLALQQASVIGQVFWDRALLALDAQTEITLPRLVQRELALPRQDTEADGLREYAFKHAILHQVTYSTVLKRQRKSLHGKLADWLAAQSQSTSIRAGDFLGATAQHYEEAGDDARAAEFHALAAEHAAERLAHAAVLGHVRQALTLLDRAGDAPSQASLRWRLLRARELTLGILGERERQALDLDAMNRVAETLCDDARRSYAAYRRSARAFHVSLYVECEQSAQHAVACADSALVSRSAGLISIDGENRLREQRLNSLTMVSMALRRQGRREDSLAVAQQTLEAASAHGLLKPQALCLQVLGLLAEDRGDLVGALDLMRASQKFFRQAGDQQQEGISLINVGSNWLILGDLLAAGHELEAGLRLVRRTGDRRAESANLCLLSELAHWQGDDARAAALAIDARDLAVAVHERDFEAFALLCLGRAEEALGRLASATRAYAQAQRAGRHIGSRKHLDASAGLARLALLQGDIGAALQEARSMVLLADAEGAVADGVRQAGEPAMGGAAAAANFDGAEFPRQVELTLYRVFAAAGDPVGTAWLRRAHTVLMAQADSITDKGLREKFLANIPHHREIVALWQARAGDR